MAVKAQQLQIRVTAAEKAALRARAKAAGMDVSSYVLARALPVAAERFRSLAAALRRPAERSYALAALHDLLVALSARDYEAALASPPPAALPTLEQNLLAAMVEHRAAQLEVAPPTWARAIPPLDEPWFAGGLRSLRPYLIAASPAAFRRRNLFVDSTLGDRV